MLAARPSMGKTALATNIAEYVAIEANVPTLFVSLEMARLELAQRMLCSQGKIDANKFRSGFISKEDRIEAGRGVGQAEQGAAAGSTTRPAALAPRSPPAPGG